MGPNVDCFCLDDGAHSSCLQMPRSQVVTLVGLPGLGIGSADLERSTVYDTIKAPVLCLWLLVAM